jgi:hypothetical protein
VRYCVPNNNNNGCSSEKSVDFYRTTRCHRTLNSHCTVSVCAPDLEPSSSALNRTGTPRTFSCHSSPLHGSSPPPTAKEHILYESLNCHWLLTKYMKPLLFKIRRIYSNRDHLCGLVVRVLGYRSGDPGSIPGTTRKKKRYWVWNGVHSAS